MTSIILLGVLGVIAVGGVTLSLVDNENPLAQSSASGQRSIGTASRETNPVRLTSINPDTAKKLENEINKNKVATAKDVTTKSELSPESSSELESDHSKKSQFSKTSSESSGVQSFSQDEKRYNPSQKMNRGKIWVESKSSDSNSSSSEELKEEEDESSKSSKESQSTKKPLKIGEIKSFKEESDEEGKTSKSLLSKKSKSNKINNNKSFEEDEKSEEREYSSGTEIDTPNSRLSQIEKEITNNKTDVVSKIYEIIAEMNKCLKRSIHKIGQSEKFDDADEIIKKTRLQHEYYNKILLTLIKKHCQLKQYPKTKEMLDVYNKTFEQEDNEKLYVDFRLDYFKKLSDIQLVRSYEDDFNTGKQTREDVLRVLKSNLRDATKVLKTEIARSQSFDNDIDLKITKYRQIIFGTTYLLTKIIENDKMFRYPKTEKCIKKLKSFYNDRDLTNQKMYERLKNKQ